MADNTAISLTNVSKVFKRYHRPVDRLKEILLPGKQRADEFWALRDINLEIAKGETVGIIGRNGSGKSTLLQIIAGTLQPTTGNVKVNGRVSALLELGSGFNPEFTGRQNVFFNGQILGLSQAEIESKFDEIAAFSDIGDFINQPVKTYSSGMFVKLAFAVAINSDPDILIVDEALSVGDEAFQRKCFARLFSIQEKGATVLFVSHSAGSVVELCDIATLLDRGELILNGLPKTVVANYQKLIYSPEDKRTEIRDALKRGDSEQSFKSTSTIGTSELLYTPTSLTGLVYDPYLVPQHTISYDSRGAKIKDPGIRTINGKQANLLARNQRYHYKYTVYFSQEAFKVRFGMLMKTLTGFELGGAVSHAVGKEIKHIPAHSLFNIDFCFKCSLLPGTYFLNAGIVGEVEGESVYLDRAIDIVMFKVQPETCLKQTGIIDFDVTSKVSDRSMVI